jgi:hypothetical protein
MLILKNGSREHQPISFSNITERIQIRDNVVDSDLVVFSNQNLEKQANFHGNSVTEIQNFSEKSISSRRFFITEG